MSISRRSFLKMAGLTTVAAAGAALLAGCGAGGGMGGLAAYVTIEMDESVYKKIYELEGVTDAEQQKKRKEEIDQQLKNLNTIAMLNPGPTTATKTEVLKELKERDYLKSATKKSQELYPLLDVEGEGEVIKASGGLGGVYQQLLIKLIVKNG